MSKCTGGEKDGCEPSLSDQIKEWLFNPEPKQKPDDPNSYMYKFSDLLGRLIDEVSDLITSGVVVLSSVPVVLLEKVLGRNPFSRGGCEDCNCHN